ncbi:hypothetical protein H6G33_33890 [Calothrix sp. FACHB-1219]|uniref:hypothetical protein n=1 Tax=unclassified Calothrix TaxID=2619626 RepID=UPI001688AA08|nr:MULTISPECIES: hypothetical protein [unclassified Calothrix]MBD2207326.1 hypothetical protein [Calothrix sp. FACHB-168]MBD2221947.1 hypothetical protein [Calothrix sp. FACHB-1219]
MPIAQPKTTAFDVPMMVAAAAISAWDKPQVAVIVSQESDRACSKGHPIFSIPNQFVVRASCSLVFKSEQDARTTEFG